MEFWCTSYLVKYVVSGGGKDIITFFNVFEADISVVNGLVEIFFDAKETTVMPSEKSILLQHFLEASGNFYNVINGTLPTMIIGDDNRFVLKNKGCSINNGISEKNLELIGFNNLKDIFNGEYVYQVVFTTRLERENPQSNYIFRSDISLPLKKSNQR